MLKLIVFILVSSTLSQNIASSGSQELEYAAVPQSCESRCSETASEFVALQLLNETETPLCSCSPHCSLQKSCCHDYIQECWPDRLPSCVGLCLNEISDDTLPCQCGPFCIVEDNCCPDYTKICLMHTVEDEELEDMAESLLFWDNNTLSHSIHVNLGHKTDRTCNNDVAELPLLQMNGQFTTTTYLKLMALYDDFFDDISLNETVGVGETVDMFGFITEVVKSRLMEGVQKFLVEKGFVTNNNFVDTLRRIWFGLYSRQVQGQGQNSNSNVAGGLGSALGSSGFENVFMGETTSTSVEGFQNWVYFLKQSEAGNIEYNGYIDELVLNKKASVVSMNFKWHGKCKQLGTIFVGTSPEFEFALYTLCWFTRPNMACPALLGGHRIAIQTFEEIDSRGQRFVASAHPVIFQGGGGGHGVDLNVNLIFIVFLITLYGI